MTTAKAAATQLCVAREASPGVAPTTGWMRLEPNPGGLQNFHSEGVFVARNPLSPFMAPEKGARVGESAAPVLVHDLNKDFVDIFGEGLLRAKAKGAATIHRPSAVTSTGYTVASGGALAEGLLVVARGFSNPANNGVKVVGSGSTATEIKATGLVAEVPTDTVSLEVCGVQGAAGDIEIDASGDLISTVLDFSTLGLIEGSRIFIGGVATANHFASVPAGSYATVAAVAAHKITLKWRSWTPGAADDGAGKTIRLRFGRVYRNVPDGHADYVEPSWHGEHMDSGVGTANGKVYSYLPQMVIGSLSIAMPVQSKVEVTANFLARKVTAPVDAGERIAGPSAALEPLATNLMHTSCDSLLVHRVVDASDDSLLIAEVNSATLSIAHNVTPRTELGACGATGMIFGNIVPSVDLETYFERAAVPRAIANVTTCRYEAILANTQCSITIDLPGITLQGGAKTYAENSPVMMAIAAPAHREGTTIAIINVIPAAEV